MLARLTQVVLNQVDLPPAEKPSPGSLFDSIFGPLMPLISGAWWLVLHLVLPLALIAGVLGLIAALIVGDRRSAARARGVIFGVPLALFLVAAAILVSNWVVTTWG